MLSAFLFFANNGSTYLDFSSSIFSCSLRHKTENLKTFCQCLSRALRDDNPKLLTAASAFLLPVQPLMVSAVHTGMMEVTHFAGPLAFIYLLHVSFTFPITNCFVALGNHVKWDVNITPCVPLLNILVFVTDFILHFFHI
jgi:hypothetical protein